MFRSFRQLMERQIQKARGEGQLSGLAGQGKPLPEGPSDTLIDPDLAAGYRIMAEAHRQYTCMTEPDARKAAQSVLANLGMRNNITRDARKKFFR
jgi:hypothetical protein